MIEVGDQVPARYIDVSVDGVSRYLSTVQPFRWTWDTTRYESGEHVLKLTVYDAMDTIVADDELRVTIDNG